MSIIEDLFYGRIRPSETKISKTESYEDIIKDLVASEEMLTELLKEDEKELFKKFSNALSLVHAAENLHYFSVGLKLGIKMGIEIMDEDDCIHN